MTHAPPDDALSLAPEPNGFAERLRAATASVHRDAERAGIVADLIRARATRRGYAIFLRNLEPVYAALESALDHADPASTAAAFADPGLRRRAAIRADLVAIAGIDWEACCPLLPESRRYAAAIGAAGPALVAHAYARYLGDLSGGQILRPVLARTLGLGTDALTFYDFPRLADIASAKAGLRAALDRVSCGSSDAEAIVREAIAAFHHTIAVSEAVSRAAA